MKIHSLVLIAVLIAVSYTYSQNFWEKTAGPDTATTNSLAVNSNGDIFAATGDGIFRSTDDGNNWLNLGINKAIRLVFINPNDDVFVITNQQGPIFCSTNNGITWAPIGLTSWQNSIAINTNGDLFAGTDNYGVYRTTNNGGNWIQINQGLTDTHITSLIINSNQDIFAGTMFEGVFRSTDNGENWVQMSNGLTNNYIISLAIDLNDNIFAGTSGSGIFRSINNGENWIEINQGLGGESFWISSIEIYSGGDIFIGTADGVFQSTNNGGNWVQINQGLINHYVSSLGINSDDKIFAGTSGGIFRRSTITSVDITDTKIISSFELNQNFPNPFNPITKIRYSVNSNQFITLKVYDLLGTEIETLVNEEKQIGNYELNWHAGNLPSGVYLYRMQSGNPSTSSGQGFVETRKMTLLK